MALRKKPPTTLLLTDMSSLYGYIYCMLISRGFTAGCRSTAAHCI